MPLFTHEAEVRHTEEMQDIITAVPGGLLRWGITLLFAILVLILSLAAFVRYPDIVNTQLKINSPNSPKPVVAKVSGKLIKLLVDENSVVKADQPLAYIESTADHHEVLMLLDELQTYQKQILSNNTRAMVFPKLAIAQLGELQNSYQTFYQAYITYQSAINNGFYIQKRMYLQRDIVDIASQKKQILAQKELQEKDLALAGEQYEMHKKLTEQRVEAKMELKQNESIYLAKKAPLIQTETALITSNNNYSAKQKEILELDNTIAEERSKFTQSLNSLISDAESWKSKYVLTTSQSGKVSFAGIIQENQVLNVNQDVFYIDPGNEQFFGDMVIPQSSMGKVKVGQGVLVKLNSYPFEEYGMLRGTIRYIANVPYKDSVFVSRVNFKLNNTSDMKKPIRLKIGMTATAEIITQDATILSRISRNILKLIK